MPSLVSDDDDDEDPSSPALDVSDTCSDDGGGADDAPRPSMEANAYSWHSVGHGMWKRCRRRAQFTAPTDDSITVQTGTGSVNAADSADIVEAQTGHRRIGEAKNPGPVKAGDPRGADTGAGAGARGTGPNGIHFACPNKEGFFAACAHGVRPTEVETNDYFKLGIATCNGTSWAGIRRFLRCTDAAAVLAQEHHLDEHAVPFASAWAHRNGWKSVFLPAGTGNSSGTTAGVAIFARSYLGLSYPQVGGHEVVPNRVVAAVLEAPECRPMTLYSCYLYDGKGITSPNASIFADIGKHIHGQGQDAQFIVGGDFQAEPKITANLGFAKEAGAVLCAAGSKRGTCRSRRSASEIDYFFVAEGMAKAIDTVRTLELGVTRPHVPVQIDFKPMITSRRVLALRKPPPLPTERVHGPINHNDLPDWGPLREEAGELVNFAAAGGIDDVQARLDTLFSRWADTAEKELQTITGRTVLKPGLRGKKPVLKWKSIVPEKASQSNHASAAPWRWLMMAASDLARISVPLREPCSAMDDGDDNSATMDDDYGFFDNDARLDEWIAADDFDHDIHYPPQHIEAALSEQGTAADAYQRLLMASTRTVLALHAAANVGGSVDGAADRGQRAARRLGGHLEPAHQIITEIDQIVADFRQMSSAAAAHETKEALDAWTSWLKQNIDTGARHAHVYLQLPDEWRPTTAVTPDGVVTGDPMRLLESYADKYNTMWNDGHKEDNMDEDEAADWDKREHLERPTPETLRQASREFKVRTIFTYDGFHPRHFNLMTDGALEVVADMMITMELIGRLPSQCSLLTMPLIGKPKGGHRAVSSFTGIYRLWTKVRRPYLQKWESANDRPFFASGKGRGPADVVHRQAMRNEAAVGEGLQAGALMWDMQSFFEMVKRGKLRRRARSTGFPTPLLKLALAAYDGPRMLSMEGALSRVLRGSEGVTAGCGLASTLIRVYCLEPFDDFMAHIGESVPESLTLDAFVDDLILGATGTAAEVINALDAGEGLLSDVVHIDLCCRIEKSKAVVLSSSMQVRCALERLFGARAGKGGAVNAPNLGIDYTAGANRRTQNKDGRRRARFAKLRKQLKKIVTLRRVVGRKRAARVFAAGPMQMATYGAAVNGIDDQELLKLRRAAALAYTPHALGRSLSILTLLEGVPTWRAEVAPITQYANMVWASMLRGPAPGVNGHMNLAEVAKCWRAVDIKNVIDPVQNKRLWAASTGPISAMHLSLHRIQWSMTGPFTLRDDRGLDIELTAYSPTLVQQMLCDGVCRSLERQIGERLAAKSAYFDGRRACLDHLRHFLSNDKWWTPKARGVYRSVLCGAIWTYSRAAAGGYIVDDVCPLCGCVGDTIHHRVWECCHPAARDARNAVAPDWLQKEAHAVGVGNPFYTTAIMRHPGDVIPPPTSVPSVFWYGSDEHGGIADGRKWEEEHQPTVPPPLLSGQLYTDGSCTTNIFKELRRAAASVVARPLGGPVTSRALLPVYAPLPQSPQAAEFLAGAFAHSATDANAADGSRIGTDCSNVCNTINAGIPHMMSRRQMYAGLLKEVWADSGRMRATTIFKVKAHQIDDGVEAVPAGAEREHAIGNAEADNAAKEGLRHHPVADKITLDGIDNEYKRARLIARTIATVMETFPPMPKDKRMQRMPAIRDGANIRGTGGHNWVFRYGAWRCLRCLRMVIGEQVTAKAVNSPCQGKKRGARHGRHDGSRSSDCKDV